MRYFASVLTLLLAAYSGIAAEPECGVLCNGGYASGTLIKGAPSGKTWVLTNRHVVQAGASQVKNDGKDYDIRVLIVSDDPMVDLAVLEIDQEVEGAIAVAAENPTPRTRLRLRGHGVNSGGFDKIRTGFLNRFGNNHRLTTPMFISPGDSGSGLIDEDKNELVGVIWGCQMTPAGGGPGVAVPAGKVRELLGRIPRPPEPKRLAYRF